MHSMFGCFQLVDDPRKVGGAAPPVSKDEAEHMLATLNSNYSVVIETNRSTLRECSNLLTSFVSEKQNVGWRVPDRFKLLQVP